MYECSGVINAFETAWSSGAKRVNYRLNVTAGPRPQPMGALRRVRAVGGVGGVPSYGQRWA